MASKMCLQVSFDVITARGDEWTRGLTEVMQAFEKSGQQMPEVMETHVGGGERVYMRVYLDRYADLDDWKHVPDVVKAANGDSYMDILTRWASSFNNWESRILATWDPSDHK